MKTQVHKPKQKRRNILLTTAMIAVLTLSQLASMAQDLKTKYANVKNLLEKMDVKYTDTNYTFKRNEDSARWELYNREIDLYESNNQLLAIINQRYDPESGGWERYDRTIKTYNDRGNLIENLHQEWHPNLKKWMNLKIKTISYNGQNEKEEILYHEWREAMGRWISTIRYHVSYNLNGEESNVLVKVYDPATNTWKKNTRYTFTYEGDMGQPTETLIERFDSFSKTWQKSGKYVLNHNLRGETTREVHITWNKSLNDWINGLQFKRTYNKNQLMSEVKQRWDYSQKIWHNALRSNFNYDDKGELSKLVEEVWSPDSVAWQVKNQYLYSDVKEIDLKKNE